MKDDNFIISTKIKDSRFILRDKTVVQLTEWDNTYKRGVGIIYRNDGDLFETPLKSTDLDIYVCSPTNKRRNIQRGDIVNKMYKLPYRDKFVAIPLVHGDKNNLKKCIYLKILISNSFVVYL